MEKNKENLQRVSSNATLFLRLAFPIFWIMFFASFGLMFLVLKSDEVPMFQHPMFKIGYLVFFAIGVIVLWTTFMKLKRVDMSPERFFVTDYLRTYKYTYDSISKISEVNFLIFKVVVLTLKEKGSFGKKIRFVGSRRLWNDFFNNHPGLFAHAVGE